MMYSPSRLSGLASSAKKSALSTQQEQHSIGAICNIIKYVAEALARWHIIDRPDAQRSARRNQVCAQLRLSLGILAAEADQISLLLRVRVVPPQQPEPLCTIHRCQCSRFLGHPWLHDAPPGYPASVPQRPQSPAQQQGDSWQGGKGGAVKADPPASPASPPSPGPQAGRFDALGDCGRQCEFLRQQQVQVQP